MPGFGNEMWEERLHFSIIDAWRALRDPLARPPTGAAPERRAARLAGGQGPPGRRRGAISERSVAELRDRSDAHDPGGERPGLLAQLGDGRRLPDVAAPERPEGEEMSARPEDRAVGIGGETHSQAARAREPGGENRGKERRAGIV